MRGRWKGGTSDLLGHVLVVRLLRDGDHKGRRLEVTELVVQREVDAASNVSGGRTLLLFF